MRRLFAYLLLLMAGFLGGFLMKADEPFKDKEVLLKDTFSNGRGYRSTDFAGRDIKITGNRFDQATFVFCDPRCGKKVYNSADEVGPRRDAALYPGWHPRGPILIKNGEYKP